MTDHQKITFGGRFFTLESKKLGPREVLWKRRAQMCIFKDAEVFGLGRITSVEE